MQEKNKNQLKVKNKGQSEDCPLPDPLDQEDQSDGLVVK
jgi:hypothetical protein